MIKIIGARGCGKTTKILKISEKTQIPILCTGEQQRRHIIEKANIEGYKIPKPLIFTNCNGMDSKVKVLIDDGEIFLKGLLGGFGYSLEGFAISKDSLGDKFYAI